MSAEYDERVADASAAVAVGATAAAKGGPSPLARQERRAAFLFILPWVIGFLVFTAGPAIASVYFSLTDYNVIQSPEWVGFQNYVRIVTEDELFRIALVNTVVYALIYIPLHIGTALIIAMLLNARVRGLPVWRTIFYVSSVTPIVATAILWRFLLNPQVGAINKLLGALGLPTPGWTTDPDWMIASLGIMVTWGAAGNAMIIFLAGLKGVPTELYEAAEIDGAGFWKKTWNVTLPMISPVLFFQVVVGVIAALQTFAQSRILFDEEGGIGHGGLLYLMYLFNNAFQYFRMGYASALAWILFVVIISFTIFQFWLSKRWVYYEGESK